MRSQRAAVSIAFLFLGINTGALLPRLSAIKDHLGITDGQVGVGFLVLGIGSVIGALAARLVLGRGARLPGRILVFALCVLLAALGLAPNFAWFVGVLLVSGVCIGLVDVLMNAQATEIERLAGRPMINSFHAFWSLGSILGSAGAIAAAALAVPPSIHLTAVGVVLGVASIPLVAAVPDTRGGAAMLLAPNGGRWRFGAAVVVVSALAALTVTMEGAGGDWSAIYLRDFGQAPEGLAALGFGAFSVAMTAVRFTADWVTAARGARVVAGVGGMVAGAGFLLAVGFPAPLWAIAGFGLVGAGVAVMFPLAMTAASNLDEAGHALGITTAAGYAGAIVGPPLIGGAADHFGLRIALLIPALAGFAVVAMMATTRTLPSRPS